MMSTPQQTNGGPQLSETVRTRTVPTRNPGRVLLVIDQPVLAKVVALALYHGHFVTHVVATEATAMAALGEWQPQLAVIDMDLTGGQILAQLGGAAAGAERVPVVA